MAKPRNTKLSDELKLKGNKSYSAGKYLEAIEFYTAAIDNDSENGLLYSNRSMANLKLKRSFEAERDADAALRLDGTLDKAYYRRAVARRDLFRYASAVQDLKRTLELSPTNVEAQRELDSLNTFLQHNKTVKLVPVNKPESLRSKASLRSLAIHFDVDNHDDVPIVNEQLSEIIRKRVIERIPENAVEFERDWREFDTVRDRVQYLEKLDIELLKRLFQYQIEVKMFGELIEVLHDCQNDDFVLQALTILSHTHWLPLTVMLLDDHRLSLIATILERLSADGTQSRLCSPEMLQRLQHSFQLN